MTRTVLLHCPVRAEIRTVDTQPDLRILFQLWLWTKKSYLLSELTKGFDLKGRIKGFCTLTQKCNGLYQKQEGVSERVFLNNSTYFALFSFFRFFYLFLSSLYPPQQYNFPSLKPSRGCCLTGVSSPEAPTIWPRATKIANKEPEQAPETFDSQDNFR